MDANILHRSRSSRMRLRTSCSFLAGLLLSAAQVAALTFEPKFDVAVGTAPLGIAIADMDRDGKNDLVVTAHEDDTVAILRNVGGAEGLSFADKIVLSAGLHPQGVALVDLDGDGNLEMAVANSGRAGGGSLAIFRNLSSPGAISFSTPIHLTVDTATRVVAEDIDGDGLVDLAVTSNARGEIYLFRNTSVPGSLSLSRLLILQAGHYTGALGISDIDADGRPDILAPTVLGNYMPIFLNNSSPGSFAFAPRQDFQVSDFPEEIDIDDLNGDGRQEIVVTNRLSNSVALFVNNSTPGDLSLSRHDFFAGEQPNGLALVDLNGDGTLDVVVTNADDTLALLLADLSASGPSLSLADHVRAGEGPFLLAVGDFDGDGTEDIAASNSDTTTASVIRNTTPLNLNAALRFNLPIESRTRNVPFMVTIDAVGSDGLLPYNGTVRLASSLGQVNPFRLQMLDGRAAGEVAIDTSGRAVTLSATAFGLAAMSNPFDLAGEDKPGWISGRVEQWSVVTGSTVPAPPESHVHVHDHFGNQSSAEVVDGSFQTDLLPCGSYVISAEGGGAQTDWKQVSVPCGFGVSTRSVIPAIDCDTSGLTPILLLPGIAGSTISSGLVPELPVGTIAWDDDRWPTWSWSGSLTDANGFSVLSQGGLYPGAGWHQLVQRLREANSNYVPYCGIFPVPYDWRLHPSEVSTKFLRNQIANVKKMTGASRVHIVAHSMGGLVARAYINGESYADDIDRLAVVGTPNQGLPLAYYLWAGRPPTLVHHTLLAKLMFAHDKRRGVLSPSQIRSFVHEHVKSIQALLPTYPFLERRAFFDVLSCSENEGNSWLATLNETDLLKNRVEARAFSGQGLATTERIMVGERDCDRSNGFKDGVPLVGCDLQNCYSLEFKSDGDGRVPALSTAIPGIASAPAAAGVHDRLIGTLADPIATFLLGLEVAARLPQRAIAAPTEATPVVALSIGIDGPFQPLLEDPLLRRLGMHPENGNLLEEIPDATFFSGPHGASMAIATPAIGSYHLQLNSAAITDYHLRLACTDDQELLLHGYHHGDTSDVRFTFDPNASPCFIAEEPASAPMEVRADFVHELSTTRVTWPPASQPGLAFYRVYGRRVDEPVLKLLTETSGTTFEPGDPWAGTVDVPVRMYAVSAVDLAGLETLLSVAVFNDDRDHDGISDVREAELGLPLDGPDADNDGLLDGQELTHGTDPQIWDSDGDGFSDGEEILAASDPLEPNSDPGCQVGRRLTVPAQLVEGERLFEACESVKTEAGVRIMASGRATFRSSGRVTFGNGLTVEAGGRLVVEISP
jgi:pimeloyl-ACP methyl ester carboxylesterase